jgi:hypothetical protein
LPAGDCFVGLAASSHRIEALEPPHQSVIVS